MYKKFKEITEIFARLCFLLTKIVPCLIVLQIIDNDLLAFIIPYADNGGIIGKQKRLNDVI
jgi:hypothetical protein